ncbi:hypothetical protein [Halomicrococcus sp. NG-SE-24]|uniref:hypothetical protein n=1 Tax=Halomicrococcus sp. NG-SE-24 TaxID=3436928 RepID=UPI003D961F3B
MTNQGASISRGDVVWAVDPFKDEPAARPLIVISNSSHPFENEQWLATVVSTTPRNAALKLTNEVWRDGSLPQTSYAYPWAILSPRIEQIDYIVGSVTSPFVDQIITNLNSYLE